MSGQQDHIKDTPLKETEEDKEEGEISGTTSHISTSKSAVADGDLIEDMEEPPLPDEEAPPLPDELPPGDDGWDAVFDEQKQVWYFYNRFTKATQWDNPRVPMASSSSAPGMNYDEPAPAKPERPVAGGYNPAIHGDYDPDADYAKEDEEPEETLPAITDPSQIYAATGSFNRFTGKWQADDLGPDNHNDAAKSKRQMQAFFDVDAAANSHDGRSLKEERRNKKLSKEQVKAFNEKRKAKKEEKRRAWLKD